MSEYDVPIGVGGIDDRLTALDATLWRSGLRRLGVVAVQAGFSALPIASAVHRFAMLSYRESISIATDRQTLAFTAAIALAIQFAGQAAGAAVGGKYCDTNGRRKTILIGFVGNAVRLSHGNNLVHRGLLCYWVLPSKSKSPAQPTPGRKSKGRSASPVPIGRARPPTRATVSMRPPTKLTTSFLTAGFFFLAAGSFFCRLSVLLLVLLPRGDVGALGWFASVSLNCVRFTHTRHGVFSVSARRTIVTYPLQ